MVEPHDNWTAFEDKPSVKPYREMLKDVFGAAEEQAISQELDSAVAYTTSQIIQFRPDPELLARQVMRAAPAGRQRPATSPGSIPGIAELGRGRPHPALAPSNSVKAFTMSEGSGRIV